MNERLIAIGDIHGCREALEALIAAIKPGPDDTVVTLGDYVDRGPDSAGVIDTLLELGNRTQLISLIGNHEEMMLDVIRGHESHHNWLRYGGVETLDSYQFSGNLDFLPPEHEAFFNSLGDFYESENHFFVHACYDSKVPLADQPIDLLRWTSLREKMPQPHRNGKIAVVGHTACQDGEILNLEHLICLDTYCYGGQFLTAMDLNNQTVWQASPDGRLR